MIKINRDVECCGCSACAQICASQAITMVRDSKGFLYPKVDSKKCSNCELCTKVCPILNENAIRFPNHVYALKNKNIEIRTNSSSGGIFTILAENTIKSGGCVYGAVFNEKWQVCHSRISEIKDIVRLRGSKYVQSQIGDIYIKVKEDLLAGINVLFSGTPCQVAGLNRFLRKPYENLLTVDFVCHGVPNPRIWEEFLIEEKKKQKIDIYRSICFRDKKNGWHNYSFAVDYSTILKEEKNETTDIKKHPYMLLFIKDYILRPSCHECHFRCGKSNAVYTIGDYWDIEKFYPFFSDDLGVSLLLSYDTSLPNILKSQTDFIETKLEEACYGNICIKYSWPFNPISRVFYFVHDKLGLGIEKSLMISIFATEKWKKIKHCKERIISLIHKCFEYVENRSCHI